MHRTRPITLIAGMALGIVGCQQETVMTTPNATTQTATVAGSADDVRPLREGATAPTATLRRPDGRPAELSELYRQSPTVLIFYRGGWCPYCNTHLGQIAQVEADLIDMGFQVLAVSPDRPQALQASIDEQGYAYQLLSDSRTTLAQAFGLAFRVDDPTIDNYRGYGIDLVEASGHDHHILPVPAVYIVDTRGVIRFAHWNPDYTRRLEPDELKVAARQVIGR